MNGATTLATLTVLLPELILMLLAVGLITAGAFVAMPRRAATAAAALSLVAALIALAFTRGAPIDPYAAVSLNDALSYYGRGFLILTGLALVALSHDQVADERSPEYFGCLLLIIAGSMLVTTANELVFLFIGLELVSIPTYILLYLPRRNLATLEAATKYFYLSIFSSALLLFGLAYLYGLTGISNLRALAFVLHRGGSVVTSTNVGFGLIAVLFIMAGLGFRVAAVPFHFYAPDVYQGSATVVTAMLAWFPKAIGFVAMIRALTSTLSLGSDLLTSKAMLLCWLLAVATMTLANFVALSQTNLKRLLAYSSIAHAGYLLIGIAAAFSHVDDPESPLSNLGAESVLFYLVTYALMTLGAFAVLIILNTGKARYETIDDLSGLARTRPVIALAMAIFLFSLAGIPPLAGFWGKFLIFAAAWTADPPSRLPSFRLLTVIGVLNAAIGAYYYLRVLMAMYFSAPREPEFGGSEHAKSAGPIAWPKLATVGACAVLTVGLGLYPGPLQRASRLSAVESLGLPRPIASAASNGLSEPVALRQTTPPLLATESR